nr:MAG TPA: hypothetical protein [Caudoviricetes sp.]
MSDRSLRYSSNTGMLGLTCKLNHRVKGDLSSLPYYDILTMSALLYPKSAD